MKVSLEDIWDLQNQLNQINNYKFEEIEWYYDGEKLEISQELKDTFKVKYLPNLNFIEEIEQEIDLNEIAMRHENEWQKELERIRNVEHLTIGPVQAKQLQKETVDKLNQLILKKEK